VQSAVACVVQSAAFALSNLARDQQTHRLAVTSILYKHTFGTCPASDHARRDTWPGDTFTTDPRRLWSYLEWIGAVNPPPRLGMRERAYVHCFMHACMLVTLPYLVNVLSDRICGLVSVCLCKLSCETVG